MSAAAPRDQLLISAVNRRICVVNALWYRWLTQVTCHFRDCNALLVESLTSSAVASSLPGVFSSGSSKRLDSFHMSATHLNTSAGMASSPMTKFIAALAYLKSHSLFANEDLGLFGLVARLYTHCTSTKARDGERPSQEWTSATGVTATEALQLAEDRPFWRTIATAGGFG